VISFIEEGVKSKLTNRRVIKKWISEVANSYGFNVGNLCYIFCDDEYILNVNREYLQHDYYTDIITFDYVIENTVSGDMYISVDTVLSNSKIYSSSYIIELHRVIIHGVLHLCGLKDKTHDDELKMREAEDKALLLLSRLIQQNHLGKLTNQN
jgi:rRNA maturation RNase YbeY